MDDSGKKLALSEIMAKVHALAEVAWPRDGRGVSDMPEDVELAIIECQEVAARALGLPDNLDLMTGNPATDLT